MYFQSLFILPGEKSVSGAAISHCMVNITQQQTTGKFLAIDLQSLAMSSWRHSMTSRTFRVT